MWDIGFEQVKNKNAVFTNPQPKNLYLRQYALPTARLVSLFSKSNHLFFYLKNGLLDVLNYGICTRMRIGRDFLPATFQEFSDLSSWVDYEQEAFLSRNVDYEFTRSFIDETNIIVELIEEEIEKFCDQVWPDSTKGEVHMLNPNWVGDTMCVDLQISQ